MTIRLMTAADYDDVYSLWLSTPGMGLNNIDDTREGIEKYLRRNPTTCFIAEESGSVIGVILTGHDGRRGYIHHLAVAGDCQRQGVGSALLEAALNSLKEEGIIKVALVVFSHNEKGNRFWEKMGFTLREDILYRNKSLTDITRIDT